MPDQPNLLLIFSDQHHGDALGCVGNPVVRTPNLDGLAAEGVLFGNCNTNSPLCMPARAPLMTGMYVNELYSDGHSVGEPVRPLASISQEVPRQGGLIPNYDGIVKDAAEKLEADFGRVVETLGKLHNGGRG